MNNFKLKTSRYSIPTDILDDLLIRFLLFVPESSKQNLTRICFHIESAYWFYLDFYVVKDKRLKVYNMYEFATHVFQVSFRFKIEFRDSISISNRLIFLI